MVSALPITHAPSQDQSLAKSLASAGLQQRWARFQARVQELRQQESAAAAAIAADLQQHPGYYAAAVARNRELLVQHADRPDLRWAMVRWAEIFDTGGLPLVLQMLSQPETHQELLSSSPLYLMRPPLPENEFYQAYPPATMPGSRHRERRGSKVVMHCSAKPVCAGSPRIHFTLRISQKARRKEYSDSCPVWSIGASAKDLYSLSKKHLAKSCKIISFNRLGNAPQRLS